MIYDLCWFVRRKCKKNRR